MSARRWLYTRPVLLLRTLWWSVLVLGMVVVRRLV
jgi:hypothetical protein